jgi:1D-myo-inositol 3-kinase
VTEAGVPPDYVVIGHVTRDLQPDGRTLPGGTALFAGLTAARLGRRVAIVTAGADPDGVRALVPGAQTQCQPSAATTTFVNRYVDGQRTQYVLATAAPIDLGLVPDAWRRAPVVHLGPLTGEIAPAGLAGYAPDWLCATPQGWLRRWDADGLVTLAPPDAATFATVPLRALVLSEGSEEECSGALIGQVLARGGLVAVTRGARGSTLLHGGERLHVPAYPVEEVDPTGAGDVYAAALFIRLAAGDAPPAAAAYASAAGALCVTGPGASTIPDDAAIRRLMARHQGAGIG